MNVLHTFIAQQFFSGLSGKINLFFIEIILGPTRLINNFFPRQIRSAYEYFSKCMCHQILRDCILLKNIRKKITSTFNIVIYNSTIKHQLFTLITNINYSHYKRVQIGNS